MFKIIGLFSLLFYTFSVSGQTTIRRFVKNHTVPITAIHPDSTDFSDLESIGKAIGDARIINQQI